jgi:hypothetical protein
MTFQNANIRRIITGAILLAALVGGLWLWGGKQTELPKPKIAMMSSIPLKWGEASVGDIAKGETQPSAFYRLVSEIGRVTMIDTVASLKKLKPELLILVQPRLLEPQELVELDLWIRQGGRALIFADPALQWPSDYPLGDNRRPLFTSFLSPLFSHWGIELVLPVTNDEEQVTDVQVGDQSLQVISHGNWLPKVAAEKSRMCFIDKSALAAICTLGKGRAVLIADADLLEDAQLGGGLLGSGQRDWVIRLVGGLAANGALPAGL